jgi:ABC-2 type transport system permease protein
MVVLLVFPWAASYEIRNINLSVVDNDHSDYSRRLTEKVVSSGYFRLTDMSASFGRALKSVEKNDADVILEIPPRFEHDLVADKTAKLLVAANAVNGMKGGLAGTYLSGIIGDFSKDVRSQWIVDGHGGTPAVDIVPNYRFNPHLNYKVFMVPALMVMLLTMLCGFLPALNIVGEKEAGTIEQINVTPVPKFLFIFSKLLPFWIIGFVVITIGFCIAWAVYGLLPAGHLLTIYFFAMIYIFAVSGFGLVISNYSGTMQQAMFVMFFFIMILILMSGLFTPVNSMPEWAQWIAAFNPLKYFMEVMRSVYLKGSGVFDLYRQLLALLAFAVFFNVWAVISYKKST